MARFPLIEGFWIGWGVEESLTSAELSEEAFRQHLENVEFYLNVFLPRCEPHEMEQGCFIVDEFLGNYFIRKCMWSMPSSIRSNTASFKKFY